MPEMRPLHVRWICWTAALVVLAVGAIVLITWTQAPAVAPSDFTTGTTMKANTALCLVAGGLSLLILLWRPGTRALRWASRALALLIVVVATMTLAEHMTRWDPGLDELLVDDTLTDPSTNRPGRMAAGSAAMLAMSGIALWLASTRAVLPFQIACLGAIGLAAFSMLAVSFGITDLKQLLPFSNIAPHTAGTVLLLAIGVWCFRPGERPLATFLSRRPGGVLARHAGLPLLSATVLVGAIVEAAESGGYLDQRIDSAVLVVAVVGLMAAMLARAAQSLDRSDASLRQSNRLTALANGVNQAVGRTPDRSGWLDAVCRVAVEQGGFRHAWAAWLDGDRRAQQPTWTAARGLSPGHDTPALVVELLDELAATGAAAPHQAVDTARISPDRQMAAMLIVADDRPVAVWYVESEPDYPIGTEALALLASAADDIGQAVSQMDAREAKRLSDLRFEGIIGSAMDAIVSIDEQQRVVLFNPAAERMFRCRQPDVVGQPLDSLIPERYRAAHRQHVAGFGRTGVTTRTMGALGQLYGLRADGEEFPVEASISQIEVAGRRLFTVILRDVTERFHRERLLRRQASLLDQTYDGVLVWEWRGPITYWNQGATRLYGYSAADAQGRIAHELLHTAPPERLAAMLASLDAEGRWEGEIEHVTKDGRRLVVESLMVRMRDELGDRILETNRDVTSRIHTEDQLRASVEALGAARAAAEELNAELEVRVALRTAELQAINRELEAFSYSISHDLRAPLRAMDGFSQALLEDFGTTVPDEARRYLLRIRGGAQRMGALIDDLLAFSRLGRKPLVKRRVDMTALARECVTELLQINPRPALDWRIDELPTAHGDPDLLRQVWSNLLDNAMKYSSRRDQPTIIVGSMMTDGLTTFFVKDNGTGFDMAYVDKLFGVFQRLHRPDEYEGTGVGLAIVQRIVHRHGGEVWADSAVDRGATFYFRLEGGTRNG